LRVMGIPASPLPRAHPISAVLLHGVQTGLDLWFACDWMALQPEVSKD
jgi:hypothetical protein